MGNSKPKTSDHEELSRYYAFVLNEKKSMIYTFYPKKVEKMDTSQEGSQDDGLTCSSIICLNRSSRSAGGVVNKEESWRDYFFRECKQLQNDHLWAKLLPETLKRFEGCPDVTFLHESNWINYKSDLFNKSEDEIPVLTRFSQSINEDENYQEGLYNVPSNSMANWDEALRETDIFPMDHFNQLNGGDPVKSSFSSEKLSQNVPYTSMEKLQVSHEEDQYNQKSNRASQMFKSVIDYHNNSMINNFSLKEDFDAKLRNATINHYKMITELIEKHLNFQKHPLGKLRLEYLEYFTKEFRGLKQIKDKNFLNVQLEKAFSDIQQFIRVIQECISRFYFIYRFKENLKRLFLFTRENLINFVTSLMFTPDIYNLLFEAQMNLDEETEIKIMNSMKTLENCGPEDFLVSHKFSLTQRTVAYIKSTSDNYEFVNMSPKDGAEVDLSTLNNLVASSDLADCSVIRRKMSREGDLNELKDERSTQNTNVLLKEKELNEDNDPFWEAIKCLRKIEKYRSPIHKIKCIFRCSELILECIHKFYKNHGILEFQEKIEGDDILGIFLYLCTKSRIPSLASHCNFIQKFMTNKISSSIAGYYCVTLNVAVMYLKEYKEK